MVQIFVGVFCLMKICSYICSTRTPKPLYNAQIGGRFKIKEITFMARPIKETPILTGKDAERFVKRMNEKRTVSNKEIERVKKNYEYILSIAKF